MEKIVIHYETGIFTPIFAIYGIIPGGTRPSIV